MPDKDVWLDLFKKNVWLLYCEYKNDTESDPSMREDEKYTKAAENIVAFYDPENYYNVSDERKHINVLDAFNKYFKQL